MPSPDPVDVRRIGVIGASGQVGRFLVPRLLRAGHEVVAISRRPWPTAAVQPATLRWLVSPLQGAWQAHLEAATLLAAGPLDALAEALQRDWPAGLVEVVALSSMSVLSKRHSVDPRERAIASRLWQAEESLSAACRSHGARCVLIRPTLIYGGGADGSLSPLVRWARWLRVMPSPWPASGLRQPVHAEDLAWLMLAACGRAELDGRRLQAGGGERLSFGTMLRRAVVGGAGPCLRVPVPARWLLWLRPGLRGPLARLGEDLVADNDEAERLLGYRPRGFRPRRVDFENRTPAYALVRHC